MRTYQIRTMHNKHVDLLKCRFYEITCMHTSKLTKETLNYLGIWPFAVICYVPKYEFLNHQLAKQNNIGEF